MKLLLSDFARRTWGARIAEAVPDGAGRDALVSHFGSAGTVELTAALALFMGFSKIAVALGAFPDDFPTTVIPTPGDAPVGG